jgi:uncharacterized membrane protein
MAQNSLSLMKNSAPTRSSRIGTRTIAQTRARGLGVFSLGLGLTQLFAPAVVANLIGVPDRPGTRLALRLIGARELVSGLGLLRLRAPSTWAWSRVAGDAMDLALLGSALPNSRAIRPRVTAALVAVAGAAAVDAFSAARLTRGSKVQRLIEPIHVVKSITVNRAPEEVYEFWRDLENLPTFMQHLESVRVTNGQSTWKAKGPAGLAIEWQAEIVLDRPNESIGWKSVEGSTSVPNRGVVRFAPAPGDRGTEVTVELKYEPPAGALGAAFAKLFGEEPSQQIAGDLRRLKQVLETGEVVHSDASIHQGMHPARPAADTAVIAGGGK